jgi:hypothetical protein
MPRGNVILFFYINFLINYYSTSRELTTRLILFEYYCWIKKFVKNYFKYNVVCLFIIDICSENLLLRLVF